VTSALPPKADIGTQSWNVRFVPKADIPRCSEDCRYSITSSARCCRLNGTDRPSALAVFRLMTVSYLFGACTGRSGCDAGLIARPLRVKSGHSGSFARCLLYPQKRTSILRLRMSALCGGFNRSTQHLLILLEEEVCDGGDCTNMVHAAAEG